MKLIDKAALVAEIEKGKLNHIDLTEFNSGYKNAIFDILSFINTLEVKEVNLEEEIKKYIKDNICGYCVPGTEESAKYFFELGLRAQKGE